MPNRIIKESICTSEEIDNLTPEQEVFFYRLMVSVDDYGLLDARLKILASKCFPLKSVDTKRIEAWLQALSDQSLIKRYEVDGLPYLAITKWAAHQQIRAKRPKYPFPESGSEIICNQVQANVPVIQSNPIQSESESESNTSARKRGRTSSSDKPVDVSEEVWQSFKLVRNKKKAAITDLAILGIRREAVKAGITLEDAMTICCERGWASFKADWDWRGGSKPSSGKPNANAALFASMTHLHQQPQQQPEDHNGRTIDATPLLG